MLSLQVTTRSATLALLAALLLVAPRPASSDLLSHVPLGKTISGAIDSVPGLGAVTELVSKLGDSIGDVAHQVEESTGLVRSLSETASQVGGRLGDAMTLLENTTGAVSRVESVFSTISVTVGDVSAGLASAVVRIEESTGLVRTVSGAVSGLLSRIEGVEGTLGRVSTGVTDLPRLLGEASVDLLQAAKNIPDRVQTMVDRVVARVDSTVDRMLRAVDAIPSTAVSVIEKDIGGMVDSERAMTVAADVVTKVGSRVGVVIWDRVVVPHTTELSIACAVVLACVALPSVILIAVVCMVLGATQRVRRIEQMLTERKAGRRSPSTVPKSLVF